MTVFCQGVTDWSQLLGSIDSVALGGRGGFLTADWTLIGTLMKSPESGNSDPIYQRFISVLLAVRSLNFDHGAERSETDDRREPEGERSESIHGIH